MATENMSFHNTVEMVSENRSSHNTAEMVSENRSSLNTAVIANAERDITHNARGKMNERGETPDLSSEAKQILNNNGTHITAVSTSQQQAFNNNCDVMIADVQLLSDETKWKSICSLGKGGFGEVFQYKHIKTGILIAVKVIKFDPNKDDVNYKRKSLQNEISIYTEFSKKCSVQNTEIENYGQRIVEYFGSVDDAINCTVSICLEFMQKGSLQEHLKNNGPLAESETRKYTRQLLEGLCYLHDVRSIVHRDIKAANLLITNSYDIKLADFGLSKSIDSSTHGAETQGVGTYNWMPPEVVNGDKYGFKADIWSTGCTVVEMLTTKPPWSGLRNVKIITKLAAGDYPIYTITSSSEDLQEFLKMCFRKEHRERPSAEDLLKTNFISNNN